MKDQDIWEALIGSDFALCQDYLTFVLGSTYDSPNDLNVGYIGANGEEVETNLTFEQIKMALASAIADGLTHCGDYEMADLDKSDACFAYIVFQYALYGTVVYA